MTADNWQAVRPVTRHDIDLRLAKALSRQDAKSFYEWTTKLAIVGQDKEAIHKWWYLWWRSTLGQSWWVPSP